MNNLLNEKLGQNALSGNKPDYWLDEILLDFDQKFQRLLMDVKNELDHSFAKKEVENY